MGELFGPYELLSPLATGGMGQLYLARSVRAEGFQKLLVVKMLLSHHARDQGFVQMFLDEARIAAKLNHPNICQIFDLGEEAGTYYIAMEYVPGVDLRTLQKDCADKGRPLPVPLALRIVADAASGLHYAHELSDEQGHPLHLVHRDVSPSNILVSFDGGVKIIDFGIAKARDKASVTATGQLKGKFAYMSPEQAEGEVLDRRSDLFSLGLVLHELVTGKRVLQRESDTQTLKAAREAQIDPPSKLNSAVPESLDPIVLKALSKRPEDRYATCGELSLALEDWLLKSQKPSSTAHLSAFLRELYPDHKQRARGISTESGTDGLGRTLVRTPSELGTAKTALTPSNAGRSASLPSAVQPPPRRPVVLVLGMGALIGMAAIGTALALTRKEAPPPKPPEPLEFLLKVDSTPQGAEVKLDGRLLGVTPLERKLPKGTNGFLQIERHGYDARTVALPPLEANHEVAVSLVHKEVAVKIESVPPGASVSVNGNAVGTTPLLHKVRMGEAVKIEFTLDGYQPMAKFLESDKEQAISVRLEKLPRRKAISTPFPPVESR